VASPTRLPRYVLLGALAVGLAGLAVPTHRAPAVQAQAVIEPALHTSVVMAAAPVTLRRAVRATRSRRVAPLWVRPVAAGIVSPYGMRWGRMHEGVDFGAHYGARIHAVGAGVVIGAGYLADEGGYGQIVLIRHADGVITAYAHTSRMFVHAGQHVVAGEVIGLVGATGHVTGPHLHFEVRIHGVKVNPVPWLRAHGIDV
jgi:murein DD-endopeptidase MepM/ murein hydrolase activator NlpD